MTAVSSLVARAVRQAARLGLRVAPARRQVTVYGFADDEENSLRTAAALVAAMPTSWRVTLLCQDVEHTRALLTTACRSVGYAVGTPRCIAKDSLQGLFVFITSRAFFYTHPIFGAPEPGRRRLFVNIGHGHGPKAADHVGMSGRHPADIALVNNARWGGDVIAVRGLAAGGRMVVAPNPREDALVEPVDRERLGALGIDPDKPLVAWLPTYRQSIRMRTASWQDGTPIDEDEGATAALARMGESARAAGVQLVTKFHKMDGRAAASVAYGVPVITQQDLDRAGLSFYQFLALTDGLVSDYSSVYVDYLTADKNLALFFHDAEEFVRTRGFNQPDFRQAAADLILQDEDAVQDFFDAAAGARPWRPEARRSLAEAIELAPHRYSATLDLLRAAQEQADVKGVSLPLGPAQVQQPGAPVGGVA